MVCKFAHDGALVERNFTKATHDPRSSGVDFRVTSMTIDGNRVKLAIWDTAGQERFRTLTPSYYRGAQGVICVYDVTNRPSFERLDHWMNEVDTYSTKNNAIKMLVGNKIDKVDISFIHCSFISLLAFPGDKNMLGGRCMASVQVRNAMSTVQTSREITREEGLEFAKRHRMLFIEASAKTREGVQCAFEELIEKIIQTPGLWESDRSGFALGNATQDAGTCGC
ncbi:unnamed protein product [Toxocara canis]|uniref:Ras-related protein Rab-18 n=1 Tax=Toxocara canis TaxID=6265 RepID=A0A183UD39_TOXCA|nr:unnamed protein product [Toxocara canis]